VGRGGRLPLGFGRVPAEATTVHPDNFQTLICEQR
jgi:hypothetical protein